MNNKLFYVEVDVTEEAYSMHIKPCICMAKDSKDAIRKTKARLNDMYPGFYYNISRYGYGFNATEVEFIDGVAVMDSIWYAE